MPKDLGPETAQLYNRTMRALLTQPLPSSSSAVLKTLESGTWSRRASRQISFLQQILGPKYVCTRWKEHQQIFKLGPRLCCWIEWVHYIIFTYYVLINSEGKWVWCLLRFMYTCGVDTYAHISLYTCVCIYTHISIHRYVRLCVHTCVCVHICVYTCMCIYTATYEHACGTGSCVLMTAHTYMYVYGQYALALPTKVVIF